MVNRQPVGAHYGLFDWLAQRITAVVMIVYTALLLGIALYNGGFDYPLWQALFANAAFKLATFLTMLLLFFHAWVGVRNIWMDYVKPYGARLALEALTVLALLVYTGWTIEILWSGA